MTRIRRRTARSHFQVEGLESRDMLAQVLASTPQVPHPLVGPSTGSAEVRTLDEASHAFVGPVAAQALGTEASSLYGQGYSEILSPTAPIVLGDGRTTGAIIWGRDAAGIVTLDDPVAVGLKSSPTLIYGYAFAPAYANNSIFQYSAVFTRSDGYEYRSSSFFAPGRQGQLALPLPPEVGKYTLTVRFTIYGSGTVVNEQRSHTVYVLLKTPTPTTPVGTGPDDVIDTAPLTTVDAVKAATRWATGQTTAAGVLSALTMAMYGNPMSWDYTAGDRVSDAFALLGSRGAGGYCKDFAEVLALLASLNGVHVGLSYYGWQGILPPDHPPLSGTGTNGDPDAVNDLTGLRDTWMSGDHWTVNHNDRYYDPTFGFIGHYSPDDEDDPDRNWGENLLGHWAGTPSAIGTPMYKDGRFVGWAWAGDGSVNANKWGTIRYRLISGAAG